MLEFYGGSEPGKFERIEGIDTLRFLDYGKQLKFIISENVHSLSVDTPKDLDRVKGILAKRLLSE
jgi:3-deoxy-manno-octulosonate cytidylyltransferase (CMP-KDO synthetase)